MCRAYASIPQLFPGDIEQQNYLRFLIQAAAIKAAAAAGGMDASLAHTAGEMASVGGGEGGAGAAQKGKVGIPRCHGVL